MKSLAFMCLLVVVIEVVIDNSVMAKQICRCHDVNIGGRINVAGKATYRCGKIDGLYCYTYFFDSYCEATDDQRPILDECCKTFSSFSEGTICRDIDN